MLGEDLKSRSSCRRNEQDSRPHRGVRREQEPMSKTLTKNEVDVTLYLSSAKRFADLLTVARGVASSKKTEKNKLRGRGGEDSDSGRYSQQNVDPAELQCHL